MKSILIVGYGVVGHNLYQELSKLQPDVYDKFKTRYNTKRDIKYDFCFICVDTPYIDKDNPCDISEVKNAITENDADIYIIKSTILPGTTNYLNSKFYRKNIIFSPEYYGGTQHCNNFKFDFTILGGDKEDCIKVQQLLQEVYDARHTFRIVDGATAEFTKYMENCWLGINVSFCNQMHESIEKFNKLNDTNVKYEEVRECWRLDERMPESHTYVYREHPFYDSHCLNKDIPAFADFLDVYLFKAMIEFNEMQKKKYKK